MGMGMGMEMGSGPGWILGLVVSAMVVAVAVALVRHAHRYDRPASVPLLPPTDPARQLLRQRLASGEIDDEEYLRRSSALDS